MTPPRVVSRDTEDQRSDLPVVRRATGSTPIRPTLRHQAPMPPRQRRPCDDEGAPACARQEPAGRREEEPVGPRHRRTAASSLENGEFVPQYDDFQLLELIRPKAQGSELQSPAKHNVKKREQHEASRVPRQRPHSTHRPSISGLHVAQATGLRDLDNAPFRAFFDGATSNRRYER